VTAIDFRADPATTRRYRVVSLVTRRHPGHRLGRRRNGLLRGAGQRCYRQRNRRGAVWADQDRHREEVTIATCRTVGEDDWLPAHA
jgi:hypothetical protein